MFKTINDNVLYILQNKPSTRNSDSELYLEVCNMINPMVQNMPFGHVMKNRTVLGIPGTETVRRARQKLQADHPELAANETVKGMRAELEPRYRAYAMGGA